MVNRERVRPVARRRWCVPPAMVRNPAETLEGGCVLDESPCPLGFLLWRTASDVALWGSTPEALRGCLFSESNADGRFALLLETELPRRVSAALDTIHGMLSVPDTADAETVAICCLEVAAWAHGTALVQTATAFAQAAALAAPAFAQAALTVGVYARAAGQDARAETWLRRTVALARRERDRVAYSAALVELGGIYETRGMMLLAERLYRFAFRAAERFSVRAERMRAAHGLFRLARQGGDDASAAQFALSALRALEPAAEAAAAELLLDLARFWTDTDALTRARWTLRRLVPALLTLSPARQLVAFALTARARAEPRRKYRSSIAAQAAWALLDDDTLPEPVRYTAALDLAHAAGVEGNVDAFSRAERLVLRLAPQAEYGAAVERMAGLRPNGKIRRMERSS